MGKKEAEEQAKKEVEEQAKIDKLEELKEDTTETLIDTAPLLVDKAPELKDVEEVLEATSATSKKSDEKALADSSMMSDLKSAIESLDMSKTEKETIKEITKEIEEYNEDVRELDEVKIKVSRSDLHQTKSAKWLLLAVNKMLKKVDSLQKKAEATRNARKWRPRRRRAQRENCHHSGDYRGCDKDTRKPQPDQSGSNLASTVYDGRRRRWCHQS